MTSRNDQANTQRLLKALVARGAISKEHMAEGWVRQVAVEIGLEDEEIPRTLAYGKAQGWLKDAEMGETTKAGWVSLTPAGEAAAES
jgi:hypothetical protein